MRDVSSAALIKTIARREIRQQLSNKTFWLSVVVTAVLLVASFGASSVLTGGDDEKPSVGVVSEQRPLAKALENRAESGDFSSVTVHKDDAAARAAVNEGEVDAAVLSNDSIAVERDLPGDLESSIQETHRSVTQAEQLRERGVDAADIPKTLAVKPLGTQTLDPDAERTQQRTVTTGVGVIVLFMLMLVSGLAVAQGVAEEKQSRIVEVLLAKVRAWQLLAGKITGLGTAALVQILVLTVTSLSAAVGFGALEAPTDAVGIGLSLLLWFLPGYTLFVTLYAVAGSLVSRAEDVNHVVGPVNALQMLGLVGPGLALAGKTGSSTIEILSLVPGASWAAMPVRMASEEVPWWQVGTAFALMILAVAVLVRVGSRIYSGGLLQYGGVIKVKDALASAR